MAWQSPSAHNSSPDGNNGNGGLQGNGANGGSGDGAVGTEYTLQGVMRFLQTEWHRHERDRNSWEIERAEMKARIAKLEGENRAANRLHQGFLTRIKMLETALKKERTSRVLEGVERDGQGSQKAAVENSINAKLSQQSSPLGESSSLYRAEAARNKSRAYLEKCLQEITYLLTPPNHPPPQNQPPINMESMLQQQQQQQQSQHQVLQQPSPSPNHQPPCPTGQASNQLGNAGMLSGHQQYAHSRASLSRSHEMGGQQTPFHQESQIQPQPQINTPSGSSEQSDETLQQQNTFSSSGLDYGKADTNPFSASVSAGGESAKGSSAPGDTDSWDFDETTRVGGSDLEAANSHPREIEQYSSGNHTGKANSVNRRKLSVSKHRSPSESRDSTETVASTTVLGSDSGNFKVKFALRGHLDVIRAVIFTGGGTANEPEICTAGDDGVLKRWLISGSYGLSMGLSDMDIQSHFTHRGHSGMVTCLAARPPAGGSGGEVASSTGGWIFSGGQDSTVNVWEAGKVGPKATLVGHTDVVWAVCVLPSASNILGSSDSFERVLLASGSADGTVKIWSVTPPPSPQSHSNAGSMRGSFRGTPSSAVPYTNNVPFKYSLISTITREGIIANPTCITPMSITGETFVVSYDDAAIIIYDTTSGEEIVSMMSQETYDGTPASGVNAVVASTVSLESAIEAGKGDEALMAGATGLKGGVSGMIISGHEDRYVRIFDANSGQCTYSMLAHPAAISSLALSPDGRELVSAGHDASLRFWSMEKRSCTKEITSHRPMRGEGVCSVVWSVDGRWAVSGGGDGVAKVFAR
ncbi:WD40-repeat-containing domain protein [Tuber brumale]|nr:WD40-repeat-containing domain protein [Tuber brumale]